MTFLCNNMQDENCNKEMIEVAKTLAVTNYLACESEPPQLKFVIVGKHAIGKTRLLANFVKKQQDNYRCSSPNIQESP